MVDALTFTGTELGVEKYLYLIKDSRRHERWVLALELLATIRHDADVVRVAQHPMKLRHVEWPLRLLRRGPVRQPTIGKFLKQASQ